ncbi:YgcG family protein [Microvirgula aerodenitrificans]|uniref:TPM domain-containing protein n=1 Tax=Microvirgula aerodenitrificans TaxID=57480 RepID=UPI0028E507C9|nr:YgcG family protein [Microvirgula aerodenitrificans]
MTLAATARALLTAVALACSLFAAAGPVAVPALTARVTDLTDTLDAGQRAALEQKLQAFEAKKGSQLALLIVPTTGDDTIEQYGMRVVEQWKLGRKKVDDGTLLIVARNDRSLRIEVGYGLEGALNDATAKRIISEIIVPHFRDGDFYAGIDAGLDSMMAVIDGEPLPAPQAPRGENGGGGLDLLVFAVVPVFVLGGLLRSMLGRLPAALLLGAGTAAVFEWLFATPLLLTLGAGALSFVLTLLGIVGTGGGFGGGGFSGGGGRGGGFGGGGGGFGGGGASGRW